MRLRAFAHHIEQETTLTTGDREQVRKGKARYFGRTKRTTAAIEYPNKKY